MAAIKDPENTLIMETTKGKVVIALRPDLAPKHVERIKKLAREGFYDGIVFHRVIDGFMAQTGCPKGTGTGGSKLSQPAGRVQRRAARARRVLDGARRRTPTAPTASSSSASTTPRFLDKQYTVWGKVIEGMENVDKIKRGEPVAEPRQDQVAEGGRGREVSARCQTLRV